MLSNERHGLLDLPRCSRAGDWQPASVLQTLYGLPRAGHGRLLHAARDTGSRAGGQLYRLSHAETSFEAGIRASLRQRHPNPILCSHASRWNLQGTGGEISGRGANAQVNQPRFFHQGRMAVRPYKEIDTKNNLTVTGQTITDPPMYRSPICFLSGTHGRASLIKFVTKQPDGYWITITDYRLPLVLLLTS